MIKEFLEQKPTVSEIEQILINAENAILSNQNIHLLIRDYLYNKENYKTMPDVESAEEVLSLFRKKRYSVQSIKNVAIKYEERGDVSEFVHLYNFTFNYHIERKQYRKAIFAFKEMLNDSVVKPNERTYNLVLYILTKTAIIELELTQLLEEHLRKSSSSISLINGVRLWYIYHMKIKNQKRGSIIKNETIAKYGATSFYNSVVNNFKNDFLLVTQIAKQMDEEGIKPNDNTLSTLAVVMGKVKNKPEMMNLTNQVKNRQRLIKKLLSSRLKPNVLQKVTEEFSQLDDISSEFIHQTLVKQSIETGSPQNVIFWMTKLLEKYVPDDKLLWKVCLFFREINLFSAVELYIDHVERYNIIPSTSLLMEMIIYSCYKNDLQKARGHIQSILNKNQTNLKRPQKKHLNKLLGWIVDHKPVLLNDVLNIYIHFNIPANIAVLQMMKRCYTNTGEHDKKLFIESILESIGSKSRVRKEISERVSDFNRLMFE